MSMVQNSIAWNFAEAKSSFSQGLLRACCVIGAVLLINGVACETYAATVFLIDVAGERHQMDSEGGFRIEETHSNRKTNQIVPFLPEYSSDRAVEFTVFGLGIKQPLWQVSMNADEYRGPMLASKDESKAKVQPVEKPLGGSKAPQKDSPEWTDPVKIVLPSSSRLLEGVYENASNSCSHFLFCEPQLKVRRDQNGELASVFGVDQQSGTDLVKTAPVPGRFEVLQAEYDPSGRVSRFAADFEQYDPESDSKLMGKIRFNSQVPLPEPGTFLLAFVAVLSHFGVRRRSIAMEDFSRDTGSLAPRLSS